MRAGEDDVLVSGRADGFGQPFAGDALDRLLARGVDIGDHQNVRLIEGAAEIVPEMLRARVAVRLKEHEQALVTAAARGFERGANFGGMMAVVVNQRDAAEDAFDFEAAARHPKISRARRESNPPEH